MKYSFACLCCLLLLAACSPKINPATQAQLTNPPAQGFNLTGSDAKAIAIADQVMIAMGGRAAWDQTNYIEWNFFGARKLYWDKKNDRVRIESDKDNYKLILNMKDNSSMVWKDGQRLIQADSLAKYSKMAKSMWINDSYWLVMPFKLKDSGVTLKYVGEQTTETGTAADVLALTFEGVGDTPDNKYHVFVDKNTHLVSQWSFYPTAKDKEARFVTPWDKYQVYGGIQLASGRGGYQLSEIAVKSEAPEALFSTLE